MKDPLQNSKTPYEVLGVKRGVSDPKLRMAYMKALQEHRFSSAELKTAFDALRDPVRRTRIDLLEYNDEALHKLAPCPLSDELLLAPARRAKTAAAWEGCLKETFPEIGTIHSLAILWYWWMEYEESRYGAIFDAAWSTGAAARGKTGKHALLCEINKAEGITCDPRNRARCGHKDCRWRKDCRSSAPSLDKIWHKVIAYWGTLDTMPEFWKRLSGLPDSDAQELRKTFMESLHNRLMDLSKHYTSRFQASNGGSSDDELADMTWGEGGMSRRLQQALREAGINSIGDILRAGIEKLVLIKGINRTVAEKVLEYARTIRRRNAELPELYRMLALRLLTEQRTARAVIEVGVKKRSGGEVRCGVTLLQHLGYMEAVKVALKQKLRVYPDNDRLKTLERHLSRYVEIILLLDEKKPESALEAIECLPDDERDSAEVLSLKAQALHVMALQKFSVGHHEEALEDWKTALKHAGSSTFSRDIRKDIVSTLQPWVASLQRTQPEKVITILEKVLAFVNDERLKRTLADTLAQTAIETINKVQGKSGRNEPISDQDTAACEEALARLEKGAKMGSRAATENLSRARPVVEQLKLLGRLPKNALEQMQKANEAAGRQRWGEAVTCLRKAMESVGPNPPEELKKHFAVCLTNSAVSKANEATELLADAASGQQQAVQTFVNECKSFNGLFGHRGLGYGDRNFLTDSLLGGGICVHCKTKPVQYSVSLTGHGQLQLCSTCADQLRSILDNKPKPSPLAVDLLQSAEQELQEAVDLDPSSEAPAKNLKDIREVMGKVGVPVRRAKRRAPRPPRPPARSPRPTRSIHPAQSGLLTAKQANRWSMSCHLVALVGLIFPFGNIVGPLLVWLPMRKKSAFVNEHGKESLKWQIFVSIIFVISVMVLPASFLIVALVNLIFIVIAAVKARKGEYYYYPHFFRFFR